jgi:hypothetical protein
LKVNAQVNALLRWPVNLTLDSIFIFHTETIVITRAPSHRHLPASGSRVAALGLGLGSRKSCHASNGIEQTKPQTYRMDTVITNFIKTTASFWACEIEDQHTPGGASA